MAKKYYDENGNEVKVKQKRGGFLKWLLYGFILMVVLGACGALLERILYPYLNVKAYIIGIDTIFKTIYLYINCHQTATKFIGGFLIHKKRGSI